MLSPDIVCSITKYLPKNTAVIFFKATKTDLKYYEYREPITPDLGLLLKCKCNKFISKTDNVLLLNNNTNVKELIYTIFKSELNKKKLFQFRCYQK